MSTRRILADLRRKKFCIERAINALEQLRELEQDPSANQLQQILYQSEMSNVIEFPELLRKYR